LRERKGESWWLREIVAGRWDGRGGRKVKVEVISNIRTYFGVLRLQYIQQYDR
jgi:hypothetical protein